MPTYIDTRVQLPPVPRSDLPGLLGGGKPLIWGGQAARHRVGWALGRDGDALHRVHEEDQKAS